MIINQQFNDFNLAVPPNMVGKWRCIMQNNIETRPLKPNTDDCTKFSFDIVET